MSDDTWAFNRDIEPVRGVAFAQSYRVDIRQRPLWQQRIIRVLRWFGFDVHECVIVVEVL